MQKRIINTTSPQVRPVKTIKMKTASPRGSIWEVADMSGGVAACGCGGCGCGCGCGCWRKAPLRRR